MTAIVSADPFAPRPIGWWPLSRIVLVVVVSAIGGLMAHRAPERVLGGRLDALVRHAAATEREIEPRMTGGFRWSPLAAVQRGESTDAHLSAMRSAAAEAIASSDDGASFDARHATAIARVFFGKASEAEKSLAVLATSSNDARVWSDLAGARYVTGLRENDPSQLARALAAADVALRHDPQLAEAHFNRALAIESLGLRDLARDAWDAYLRVDPESDWSMEARAHLRELLPERVFKDELERKYDLLARDPGEAHAFARLYREDSRRWGETEILGRWASAHVAGPARAAEAAKHLALARELGTELARDRGDAMLRALVAAIDRADSSQRTDLAAAHLAFRDGQKAYRGHEPARAERLFQEAVTRFERGRSPGALLARYFAANTVYSQGRIDESRDRLQELMATAPPQFIAHRAQVLWQIGLVEMAQTRWGTCIDALTESARLFERLDEKVHAASVHQSLGTANDRIGNQARAAMHRMLALRGLGQQSSSRLQMLLTSLSRTAAREQDWLTATAVFGLAIEIAKRVNDPLATVSTLLLRARLHAQMGNQVAARDDLEAASADLDKISEDAYRSFLEANAVRVEAMLSAPPTAVHLLTTAIDFHGSRGQRMLLPELLLERGRAFERLGDSKRASDDFEQGIRELESRRQTLAPDDRWNFFHDAEELFESAVALSLAARDQERAFEYVERARARLLQETLGVAWPAIVTTQIPEGVLILEYAVHDQRTVIFAVDRRGIRAIERVADRSAISAEIAELAAAARTSDRTRLRRAGRGVYRSLIEPVETELVGITTVVMVPDPRVGNLPFAAVVDEQGRFLVERSAVVVSPSAATYLKLSQEPADRGSDKVLIVSGSGDGAPLAAVEREAGRVAALYPRVTRLSRDLATKRAFRREAYEAGCIHFAGHGMSTDAAAEAGAYLLFSKEAGDDGRLDLKEIAAMRLRRTNVVVLAACATANGEVRSSEGTMSVARAFLGAGVPSVVATLWPIEDRAAAAFFPVFHRHLSRGLSPAESLRAAQLEWIERTDGPAALWAAVQVIGR